MTGGEHDTDPLRGALTHNPFAALAGGSKPRTTPASATRREPAADAPAGRGRLVVRRERKGHGGRTVTRIEGLGGAERRAEYARELARALGAGARVEGEDVVVQGDLAPRVARWCEERGHAVVRGN